MIRKDVKVLIVDDQDLECRKKKEEITLEDIGINNVGFLLSDLEKYSIIIYKGRLGKKVLRLQV